MNPWVHFRFTTDLAQQKAIGDSERDVYLTYTKLQYVLMRVPFSFVLM